MNIESMHPFCLPFGLCHDATSSLDTDTILSHTDGNGNNTSAANHNHTKTGPGRPKSLEDDDDDDLFRHEDLNVGSTSIGLLEDKLFYSLELDAEVFDRPMSREQESELSRAKKDPLEADIDLILGVQEDDELNDIENQYQQVGLDSGWFSSSHQHHDQYSLFSPPLRAGLTLSRITSSSRRKSLTSRSSCLNSHNNILPAFQNTGHPVHQANLQHQQHQQIGTNHLQNQHQVFQHVVDPNDIKSSPTLAQLNLNTNEDLADTLWESGSTGFRSALSVVSSMATPTGTQISSFAASLHPQPVATGLPFGQQSRADGNPDLLNQSLSGQSGANLVSTCSQLFGGVGTLHTTGGCTHLHHPYHHLHHLHHLHHHHHQLEGGRQCSSQNTCLAVAPFRKFEESHQADSVAAPSQVQPQQPLCCPHQHTESTSPSLKLIPSVALQHSGGLLARHLNSPTSNEHQSSPKSASTQRCASPAQVTSSSSPQSAYPTGQSCTTVVNPNGMPACGSALNSSNKLVDESRLHDSRLKENIEYLTALLCNGNNKLDEDPTGRANHQNSQQASVAPAQQQAQHQPQPQQLQHQIQPSLQVSISSNMVRNYSTLAHSLSTGPKLLEHQPSSFCMNLQQTAPHISSALNEASPNCDAHFRHLQQHQQVASVAIKRQYSTVDQQQWTGAKMTAVESSVSAADSTECQMSSLNLQEAQQARSGVRSSELKVLSSLLSSNKSQPLQSNNDGQIYPPVAQLSLWPETNSTSNSVVAQDGSARQSVALAPTGKPITLTPVVSHNGLIVQQQQQQQEKRSRAAFFAQPASPSASSTASSTVSSGELGSSSNLGPVSGLVPPSNKKQRCSLSSSKVNFNGSGGGSGSGSQRSGRPNSFSTEGSLSSHDEGFSSQVGDNEDAASIRDSDDDDDVDSDDESFYGDYTNSDLIGASISDNAENKWTLNMGRTRRNGQKRYFWQYNVQSKGPKGTRISSTDDSEDPFVLPEASDPVFSNDCQIEGVKHSGKARRGDGNDLTPNPKKLLMIGLELKKLGKIINELAPVTELPINARNKTRKEKNKLASRACRLKKKAQHEANKIKLYGLQREHQQIVMAIYDIRKWLSAELVRKEQQQQLGAPITSNNAKVTSDELANNGAQTAKEISPTSIKLNVRSIAEQCSMKVAGQTSDYVNSVLEKVVSGCIDGGLET